LAEDEHRVNCRDNFVEHNYAKSMLEATNYTVKMNVVIPLYLKRDLQELDRYWAYCIDLFRLCSDYATMFRLRPGFKDRASIKPG